MSASLTDLKKKSPSELVKIAKSMEIDGLGRMRKQDQIFTILKAIAKRGDDISGAGAMPLFTTTPINIIAPIPAITLKVVPVMAKNKKIPKIENKMVL